VVYLSTYKYTYYADKAYSSDRWILSLYSAILALAGDDDVGGVSPS
jgi:hypothetical protein